MSVQDAANRVAAFLDKHAELNGSRSDFLLQYDHTHYALRTSDLRALIAALPETHDGPLIWSVAPDAVPVLQQVRRCDRLIPHLMCECGATNQ